MKLPTNLLPKFIRDRISPHEGLGDTVKHAIEKVSYGKLRPCGGCIKRQQILNELFTYAEKKDKNSSGD